MNTKKLISKLSILLAGAIILVSCNKNDALKPGPIPEPAPTPTPVTKRLFKITTRDHDSTLFAYTTTGQLFKIISTEGAKAGEPLTYTFMYNPDSTLAEIYTNVNFKYKFVYINNQLSHSENYVNGEKVSENRFTYVGNKISSNVLFTAYPRKDYITYKHTFKTTYDYDANSDLKQLVSYALDTGSYAHTKLDEKNIHQYDNSKNPLSIISQLALVSMYEMPGEHNIVKEISLDAEGNVQSSISNTYTYDTDKYPVSRITIETPKDGPVVTRNYKYYYKVVQQ